MAMTAMRARSSPYSTMLAPVSSLVLNLASSQVFRMKRSMVFFLLLSAPRRLMMEVSAARGADYIGRSNTSPTRDDPHLHGGEDGLGGVPGGGRMGEALP